MSKLKHILQAIKAWLMLQIIVIRWPFLSEQTKDALGAVAQRSKERR